MKIFNPRLLQRFAAFSILGLVALSNAAFGQESGRYGISSTKLDNGLEVIVVENHALPLVTIELAVKNGAYTEPPEFDGLSHLYEHMFFKGNEVIPNQERYNERSRELGASWNGTTSAEVVNYYITVHKKNLREGTAFMRDAIRYPLFKEEELRREWPVVLGEFDRNEAGPGFLFFREIERRLWWRNFSRKNTIGDRNVIFNATREQMREIQRRYYVPNNTALIVGGDVQSDEVFEMAEQLFGGWERSVDPHEAWPVPKHPPLREQAERIVVVNPVMNTVVFNISWHGPSMRDNPEDTYAADVLSFILAQQDSAFQRALHDTGLVDAVDLSYYSLVHTGPITLQASTSAERLDRAWAGVLAELDRLNDPDTITDEQIQSAKNMLEINGIHEREKTSEFCHTLAFWWCTGGLDYYLNYVDKLRAVTREDLARYVDRYIKGKPRVEAVLMSEADLEKTAFDDGIEVVRPTMGSSSVAFEQPAGTGGITTEEFDVDGLQVVLRRNPMSEIVVCAVVLAGGVTYHGVENAGRELLMLGALDKGSRDYSKEEVSRRLASTGAALYADTRHDYSTFGLSTLRRDIEANFPIFADALTHPLLDAKEVELAVERQLNAVRAQEEDPDVYISILAGRNFFRGHPYAVPATGTVESLTGLTDDDLKKMHRETVTRSRLKLFVVGNMDRDQVTALVRSGLSDLPEGEFERKAVMREAEGPPRLLLEERELPTNYIWGSFDAPNFSNEDFAPLQVALSILSDRLFEEVRTKRNLSYAVSAQMSSRVSNYGILYVTAVKPNETLRVMLAEIDRLQREPVSDKVLRDKIEGMITFDLMDRQTVQSQAGLLMLFDTNGPGWRAADEAIDRMRAVTPAQIQAAALRYIKNIHFSILGDPAAIDEKLFTSR